MQAQLAEVVESLESAQSQLRSRTDKLSEKDWSKFKLGRFKTAPSFVPKGGQSRSEVLSEFVRLQADLVTIVRSADGLPLDAVKIVSPFGGRMKYSAYSALVIVPRHQHRHIEQAEEATK